MLRAAPILVCALVACEEPRKPTPAADAAPEASSPTARLPGEGCARTVSLEGVERDPACLLARPNDEAMRDLGKRVSLELRVEPPVVEAGAAATLRLTMTNTSPADVLLVLDVTTRPPGLRPDWSRLSGTPDLKPDLPDTPRLFFATTTLDGHDRNVDAMPLVAGAETAVTKWVGVRLRPGTRVSHALSWWAMRIPAPAPIVKDDAGHRFVPKTAPVPLTPGDYTINVDVPLHGIAAEERVVGTHVRVEAPPKP